MIYEKHLRLKKLVPMVFWSMKWFFKDKTICTKKKEAGWLKKTCRGINNRSENGD